MQILSVVNLQSKNVISYLTFRPVDIISGVPSSLYIYLSSHDEKLSLLQTKGFRKLFSRQKANSSCGISKFESCCDFWSKHVNVFLWGKII